MGLDGSLPVDWREERVVDCLTEPRYRRLPSVPQSEYQESGRYPIVDQGAEKIAGFTNEEAGVYPATVLPVVVFGDHTRAVKYVDFQFATGADGTKLLWPDAEILVPRYFAYALRALDLPSRGYNRHYRSLTERSIRFPRSREDQAAVAGLLAKLETRLSLEHGRLVALRDVKAATLAKLFREGLRGEPARETEVGLAPESWRIVPLHRLGEIVTGTTPPTRDLANYEGGNVPFVCPGDFGPERWIRETEKKVSEVGAAHGRRLPRGTVVAVCIGATIGKVGITVADVSCSNQQVNAIISFEEYPPAFVYYLLAHTALRLRAAAALGPVPILNKSNFASLHVAVPADRSEMEDLAQQLDTLDDSCHLAHSKALALAALFVEVLPAAVAGRMRFRNEAAA